jgi:hypothetical protein
MGRCWLLRFIAFLSLCVLAVPAVAATEGPFSGDHRSYMKGPYPDGISVTKDCITCHQKAAQEVLGSAHWLWRGPSPFVEGREDRTDLGKINLINNF